MVSEALARIAQALHQGEAVLVDIYARACVSCVLVHGPPKVGDVETTACSLCTIGSKSCVLKQ